MTQGAEWVPHLLTFQEQGLQRDDPPDLGPRTRKRTNATGTRGPRYVPEAASTSTSSATSASQGD